MGYEKECRISQRVFGMSGNVRGHRHKNPLSELFPEATFEMEKVIVSIDVGIDQRMKLQK